MKVESKKRIIHHFSSFAEAQAFEDEFAANQDPLERMAATLQLIKAIYNYQPRPENLPRTISIRKLF